MIIIDTVLISLSKMIRDEMTDDHFHEDNIRQHEHNVYHGYATLYPSYGPLYNVSDIQITSNTYHEICYIKSVWFLVAYFIINRY